MLKCYNILIFVMTTIAIPVMAHKLIPVGNSNAIIIPARIIKKHRFTSATEFDIVEVSDGIKLVPRNRALDELCFPKVRRPELSETVRSLKGSVKFSPEELEQDDRLKYILSR